MSAEQRVFGVPIMIEGRRFPLVLGMALSAFLTKTGVMDIILFVAGITVRRRVDFIERALVATLAGDFSVVALQRVGGIAVVVEKNRSPASFRVAGHTTFSKASLVFVFLLVTGVAVNGGLVLVQLALVAGVTSGAQMPPRERILGVQIMIEHDGLPALLHMARVAFPAIAPLMLVILLVAGIAISWRILERGSHVTFLALDPVVFAL